LFSIPGNGTTWSSNPFTTPINHINNRGLSTLRLLDISASVFQAGTLLVNSILSYNGFPATIPTAVTNTYFTITSQSVTDSYASNNTAYQGFYLQSATTLDLKTSSIFTPSNEKTTVTMQQIQNGVGGGSNSSQYSFYYDALSGNPTVDSLSISLNNTNHIQISGIHILYNTTRLNATTIVENIGTYFYNKDRIVSYSTGQNEVGLSNITSGKVGIQLQNTVTITNTGSNPSIQYTNTNYSHSGISISATAYNALANSTNASSNAIIVVYDQPSYNLISNTSLYPTITPGIGVGVSSGTSGRRIISGLNSVGNTPQYVTPLPPSQIYANSAYDNTVDITGSGNEELQIYNGKYRTITNGDGYLNYNTYYYTSALLNTYDYSSISSVGYRFGTFVWKCNTNVSNYTKLTIIINGILGVTSPTTVPLVNGTPIICYYRLEDANSSTTFDAAHINSMWIDANSISNQINTSNYFIIGSTLLGGKNAGIVNTYSSNNLTINTVIPSFAVSGSDTIYVYVRLGLPMNVSGEFQYVSAILS
jgi:hypothetical protein